MGLPLFAANNPSLLLLQWEMRGLGGLRRTDGNLWHRRSVKLGVVTVEALDVVGDDEQGQPRPPLGPRGRRGAAGVGAPRHALTVSAARLSGRTRGRTSCRGPVRLLSSRHRVGCECAPLTGRHTAFYGHDATPDCPMTDTFGTAHRSHCPRRRGAHAADSAVSSGPASGAPRACVPRAADVGPGALPGGPRGARHIDRAGDGDIMREIASDRDAGSSTRARSQRGCEGGGGGGAMELGHGRHPWVARKR